MKKALEFVEDLFSNAKSANDGCSFPSGKAVSKLLQTEGLHTVLNYDAYDQENHIFINQDSLGVAFECVPLTGANDDLEKSLAELFQTALPENACCGFILTGFRKSAEIMKRYLSPRATALDSIKELKNKKIIEPRLAKMKQTKEVLHEMAVERLRHLAKNAIQPIRDYRLYFWVSYGDPEQESDYEEMRRLAKTLKQALSACGLSPTPLNNSEMISYANNIIAQDGNVELLKFKANPNDPLSMQCNKQKSLLSIDDQGGAIHINQKLKLQTFSITQYPKEWCLSQSTNFIGHLLKTGLQLNSDFALSMTLYIPDQVSEVSSNDRRKLQWLDTANSNKAVFVPNADETARNLHLASTRVENGERLVRISSQVLTLSTHEEASAAEKEVRTLYRSEGFQLSSNRYISLPAFLCGFMPMWCNVEKANSLYRRGLFQTALSFNAACLSPVIAEWKGSVNESPITILLGRRGQLFPFNNFDNPSQGGNFNMGVWGKPGTGKSVFLQELAAGVLSLEGTVRSIDIGRSQEKSCRIYDGEFVNFSRNSKISLNMFTHIKELDTDRAKLIKTLVSQMCVQKRETTDAEDGLIEQAITEVFREHRQDTTITKIYQWLIDSNKGERALDLAQSLYRYTDDGMYGQYFNPPANIDLSNPYVVLELGELESMPDLQKVVLMSLMFHINEEIYLSHTRDKRQLCILDEAWALLPGGKSSHGEFFETLARRGRKHGAALVIGSQSIGDLYRTEAGQLLAGFLDWNIFLGLTSESIDAMVRAGHKNMSPFQQEVLRSLETVGGKYSEMMLCGPQGWAVGRLMLDPFSSILMSSKADDFGRVFQLEQQGVSLKDAIKIRAREVYGE